MKFGQYFAADVWLRLRGLILVEILKLGDSEIEIWSEFVYELMI